MFWAIGIYLYYTLALPELPLNENVRKVRGEINLQLPMAKKIEFWIRNLIENIGITNAFK